MILLDTHSWIWSIEGDTRRVGKKAQVLLARAESRERIRVSPVSIFEIVALHTSGRLRLSRPAEGWIRDSLSAAGVRLAEMTPSIAIDAAAIPCTTLSDPLDRLLVATARQLDATFLTADQQILQYARETLNLRAHDLTV